jgi:hypothetical protein
MKDKQRRVLHKRDVGVQDKKRASVISMNHEDKMHFKLNRVNKEDT